MDFRLGPAEPSDLESIWRLRVATMKHTIEEALTNLVNFGAS
jgi:hypothetical protein